MSLHEAALFAKVVEMNGFTAAARQLQIPKTTLSKRIRQLEKAVGVRLLNRTTRRVSVTEAGARYYEHCTNALRCMKTAAQEARDVQREPAGALRIGGPPSLTTTLLAPILVQFLKRYPRYTATLLMFSSEVDLQSGNLDVLFSMRPYDKSVHSVGLANRVEMGLFASPNYIKGFGMPAKPADLTSHQAVCYAHGTGNEEVVWRLHRGATRATVKLDVPPRFQANDPMLMRAALIAGLGIGILALRQAEESERGGHLVRVLPAWLGDPFEFNALYLDGSASSRKTKVFLDFAAQWLKSSSGMGAFFINGVAPTSRPHRNAKA